MPTPVKSPDAGPATTLTLWICRGYSGEICRAEVDQRLSTEESLPMIADAIGYVSSDWEKIGLYNMTRDFEYLPEDRWCDTWTESGDLIMMADGAACHK